MAITTEERKKITSILRDEHDDYFQTIGNLNVLYLPKMAYRPSGKDELHVTFFPSELEKEVDIYTEFVSMDYASEDPKRTLYLVKHNPHWKTEYELITSNSGFVRHMIPVSELKVINDVTSRNWNKQTAIEEGADHKSGSINTGIVDKKFDTIFDLPNPDATSDTSKIVDKLEDINQTLITLTKVINKLIK
jgi:hypothetical protein|tara:strand:+ start:165 stop:737 length:573 start_codon:yes stop_codon:yes gene_type:complete